MKKGLTLVEILIVVAVVGILVTFAVPGYNNMIEKSKARVCMTNQEVLLGAVEIYALENDQLPASLSKLNSSQMQRAWVKVLEKNGKWKTKLAQFVVNLNHRGHAHAQSWISKYVDNHQNLICPADTNGGISYGLNDALKNISRDDYENLVGSVAVVADSDEETFTTPKQRHKVVSITGTTNYAIEVKKNREFICRGKSGNSCGK